MQSIDVENWIENEEYDEFTGGSHLARAGLSSTIANYVLIGFFMVHWVLAYFFTKKYRHWRVKLHRKLCTPLPPGKLLCPKLNALFDSLGAKMRSMGQRGDNSTATQEESWLRNEARLSEEASGAPKDEEAGVELAEAATASAEAPSQEGGAPMVAEMDEDAKTGDVEVEVVEAEQVATFEEDEDEPFVEKPPFLQACSTSRLQIGLKQNALPATILAKYQQELDRRKADPQNANATRQIVHLETYNLASSTKYIDAFHLSSPTILKYLSDDASDAALRIQAALRGMQARKSTDALRKSIADEEAAKQQAEANDKNEEKPDEAPAAGDQCAQS